MSDRAANRGSETAVLLMAHGAPESLDDIPRYLDNIRYGLGELPLVVEEVRERYKKIGGASPMLGITRNQTAALQSYLDQDGQKRFRVYFAMRNWSPYIKDVVRVMLEDGVRRVVALCLAPQYSLLSTELYFAALHEALKDGGEGVEVVRIDSWCNHPALVDAFAERYRAAMDKLRGEGVEKTFTLFTVHSIPMESVDAGDPYPEEYESTVRAIVERVQPLRWAKAYQSQGKRPGPWLGPRVEAVLDRIARTGAKNVLVFPVGFVSDHIEILYDIDIAFKEYAATKNLNLHRTETLNVSPLLIEALGSIVWEHMI
jgi:ferrochelatase